MARHSGVSLELLALIGDVLIVLAATTIVRTGVVHRAIPPLSTAQATIILVTLCVVGLSVVGLGGVFRYYRPS